MTLPLWKEKGRGFQPEEKTPPKGWALLVENGPAEIPLPRAFWNTDVSSRDDWRWPSD